MRRIVAHPFWIALAMSVIFAGSVGAFLVREFREGWIVVRVDEGHPGGASFMVPVPAWAAQLAIQIVPARAFPDLDREGAQIGALAVESLGCLDDCVDVVLVDVDAGSDHVVIRKQRGSLLIEVDGSTEVSVRVPLRVIRTASRKFRTVADL